MIRYEWVIETLDGEDIQDVDHRDSFPEAQKAAGALISSGKDVRVGLVRDRFNDFDYDLEDRQWAYLEAGKLPEEFMDASGNDGSKVPGRFHCQVEGKR
jgi:hypothetical protein